MVAAKVTNMIMGMVLILIGIALIPVVFTSVGDANWTLAIGTATYDLAWVGYLIGLLSALAVLGAGIWVFTSSLGGKK